jgi:hypothetical protein
MPEDLPKGIYQEDEEYGGRYYVIGWGQIPEGWTTTDDDIIEYEGCYPIIFVEREA